MGIIQKASKFLGINKFGEGLASAGRVISGQVDQDIKTQQSADASVQKLLYAARQEKDRNKKQRLLDMAKNLGGSVTAEQIDPGLKLSNKEVLGSAANVALNVATPGAFKGGKTAVVGKNALLGAGFGAATGMEKNRDASGIAGSTVGGAVIGAGIGTVGVLAKAAKDFIGVRTPEWIMNKAVKPALQDLKKNVKFGTQTLGKELLDEGVKGGPKKLLQIADDKLTSLEDELQTILSNTDQSVSPQAQELGRKINELNAQFVAKPTPANRKALGLATKAYGEATKFIKKENLAKYVKELRAAKAGTPGLSGDVSRIDAVFNSLPDEMTLQEANLMKRRIYNELRDVSYKLDAKLGTRAAALKQIARGLKTEIENTVGGTAVQDINRKLSIYGRLENAMVDQLARNMRNNGLSLTDAILLAGGDTTSILALLRHIGQGAETQLAECVNGFETPPDRI